MSPQITSITKGPRQSNFELLRIIAMFLVMIVHADFATTKGPEWSEFLSSPANAIARVFFESVAIVCVNVFIMISGWFGIRPSLKGFCNFFFQCVYFYGVIFVAAVYAGKAELNAHNILTVFSLTEETGWFIKSYMALYILAPIVNAFIEKASKRQIEVFLLGFYIFQTIYAYSGDTTFISRGYSPISFIGLYILAAYLRRYQSSLKSYGGRIYIGCSILLTFIYIISKYVGSPLDVFMYANPIVVASSAGLVLWASDLKMKTNKTINFISKSAFGVYLFHLCPIATPYFTYSRLIYNTYSGIEYLGLIFLFMLAIFAFSVLLDQPRKWLWSAISILFNRPKKTTLA